MFSLANVVRSMKKLELEMLIVTSLQETTNGSIHIWAQTAYLFSQIFMYMNAIHEQTIFHTQFKFNNHFTVPIIHLDNTFI